MQFAIPTGLLKILNHWSRDVLDNTCSENSNDLHENIYIDARFMDCSRFIGQYPLPKYSVQLVLRTPRIAVSGNSHLCTSACSRSTKKNTRVVSIDVSRFLDLCGNLGNGKEKPTRKTCFSREKKRLTPRINQAKFCLAAFL